MPQSHEQLNAARETEKTRQQYLIKLFIASFEHSQGFQAVQCDIFRYLHFHDPALVVTAPEHDQLIATATDSILRLVGVHPYRKTSPFPHTHLNEFAVLRTVTPVARQFTDILNCPTQESLETLIPRLTKSLIERDYKFLVTERTRRARQGRVSHGASSHRLADPYFSYICAYALRGDKTGIEAFDRMYQRIGEECRAIFAEYADQPFVSQTAQHLKEVVTAYNRHHHEQPIELFRDMV